MNKARKIIQLIILVPIALVALYYTIIFLNKQNHKFSQRKWFRIETKRFELSEDLINKKILLDKSEAEVLQIIGEPTNKYDSLHFWRYNTGSETAWINDLLYFLDVHWKNGKVISVKADTVLVEF